MTDTDRKRVEGDDRQEWMVPRQRGAKDGWVEVPLWVMRNAYAIGKGHFMLKDGGDVAMPGDWIVTISGVAHVERKAAP